MNCRFCEAAIKWGFFNDEELKRLQLCYACCFWWEKVDWRANNDTHEGNRVARIKNNHYVIYPDTNGGIQGFGGREHVIRFNDGTEVTTKNLWHQGEIPRRFREQLPNNATFVDTRQTCTCRAKFYPLVDTQTKCLGCVIGAKPQRW